MYKVYKYRIYPTVEQKKQIETNFSICRYIYNIGLELKEAAWRSARIKLSAYDLSKQFTEAKKEFPWLSAACRSAIEMVLANLDIAYKKFFAGAGHPKFKSKKDRQSFTIRKDVMKVDFATQKMDVSKIKNVTIAISRSFSGEIKRITISKSATNKYFASILVKISNQSSAKPPVNSGKTVGIDIGIKSYAITSDGRTFEPNRFLKNSLKRLQCLQRRVTRKKKGSANHKKANLDVALLHEKITNQRVDYCHKITTQLIRDNQTETFVVESLNVAGMLKNAKVAQAISDVSFGEFYRQMKYKCDWYGKNLIVIDMFAPSSKRCSDCGAINQELTLTDRKWTCSCGSHHDRDLNAAKNIKYYGLLKHSGEGISGEPVEPRRIRRAKKQELINN